MVRIAVAVASRTSTSWHLPEMRVMRRFGHLAMGILALTTACGGKSSHSNGDSDHGDSTRGGASSSGGRSPSSGGSSPSTGGTSPGGSTAAGTSNGADAGSAGLGGGGQAGSPSSDRLACSTSMRTNPDCASCASGACGDLDAAVFDGECSESASCTALYCFCNDGCEGNSCACVESCLRPNAVECRTAWANLFACVDENCGDVCR
jgi:hypothetical protein